MSFEYNSSGLRTQKTVDGETKQYFYSGDLLVSEYDGLEWKDRGRFCVLTREA